MAITYQALRLSHYKITLKAWFKGLDKTLLAYVAVLQFILTAMVTMAVIGLANALSLLAEPHTSLAQRGAVVAAWQLVSFILLRALREATFMPRARSFIDALPVKSAHKLRADLLLSLLSYSFLWLPVIWAALDPLAPPAQQLAPATVLTLAQLVALSLCANLLLLKPARRQAAVALAALVVFVLARDSGAGMAAARFAALAVAMSALWHAYLPRAPRSAAPRARSAMADRLAIGSGLVIPLLSHELRTNLAVRGGVILGVLGACLLIMQLRTGPDVAQASVVVFVAAAAVLSLYTLPVLCRDVLLSKLQFLAGQSAFAQRMRLAAYGIPTLMFGAALLIAWPFDRSGTAATPALIFSLLYALGVAGTRLRIAVTSWFIPLVTMITLIILSAMT